MKETASKAILLLLDVAAIYLSIFLAYEFRSIFDDYFMEAHSQPLSAYVRFSLLYAVALIMLAYEGVYTCRYDFWHESRNVLKALVFSLIIIMAYFAMTKSIGDFSRAVIIFSFIFMVFFIPLFKNITKKTLFKIGLWRREAKIYGDDKFISEEIFRNHYLGYVKARNKAPKTVFINSAGRTAEELRKMIEQEIDQKHEVIFIPLIDEYDLTQSQIYELSNTRNNLIVFQNRLKSRYRISLKVLSDRLMFLILLPFLLPTLGIAALLIKREEPDAPVLFKQKRLGKGNLPFVCYKLRTMTGDGEAILQSYLADHPEEIEYYKKYHKYENDPRVTKIGKFLRNTSLDELPQIFNVIKGEMSFVGPRPYMLDEKKKIADRLGTILTVKPGVTGIWQVSGRSDVDFNDRVAMDVWYIRNWNLWLDLVILLKTFKTVLLRKGAS